ncbi:MAG: 3-dehydroquinate synthase [Gammaproteobacteria bacterium]
MKTLQVKLAERAYPIYIGSGLLRRPELLTPHISGRQVMVVTNETVAPLYLEVLRSSLRSFQCKQVILPDGEEHKNLETLNRIFDALLENRFNRGCTLIALGGGVVGDITGFAAASYQRGVPFIQIPTTLLAQVDSSVGGKTGVNHRLGKNMIGAFYQPRCVLADIVTLDTLDDRQFRAGLAEAIKYGLIRDADFFDWLEANMDGLLTRDPELLAYAIERCCKNKADIVAADELETGVRALLNFGHTFGHAIETATGYTSWLHGEAIAAGMCLAADLSARHGWMARGDVNRSEALLKRAALPIRPPADLDSRRFQELMAVDKKTVDQGLRLVLLKGIGNAFVTGDYRPDLLSETLAVHRQPCQTEGS